MSWIISRDGEYRAVLLVQGYSLQHVTWGLDSLDKTLHGVPQPGPPLPVQIVPEVLLVRQLHLLLLGSDVSVLLVLTDLPTLTSLQSNIVSSGQTSIFGKYLRAQLGSIISSSRSQYSRSFWRTNAQPFSEIWKYPLKERRNILIVKRQSCKFLKLYLRCISKIAAKFSGFLSKKYSAGSPGTNSSHKDKIPWEKYFSFDLNDI